MRMLNKKLMNWASILETSTREQAERTATMPFIFPHVALMSDAHLGKGATVGSVIPTLGAIIPAAVGVDIGCGMEAVRTQLTAADMHRDDLPALRVAIEKAIPLSAGKYNTGIYSDETAHRIAELEAHRVSTARMPSRRTGDFSLALSGPAITLLSSVSTSRIGSGSSCTPGHAESATSSR